MGDGYAVNAEQIRAHAAKVEQIQARFDAVKSASAHITQDDQAYGLLCGWISGILEGRHARQDELISYVAENLSLAAESLRAAADDYQAMDEDHAAQIKTSGGGMP
ncbi:type VII secretion target [Saccharopolyspora flava]|uniref:Excreted virulence factor EspC, type VII ESX diderm n=1 Tax=Saccharopolyspora flava TaxID=95161 RepID=A0A1I6PBS8_9PSEU|nr:type VII secretion target [Saccharopolyspora flava]SFS37621.1 Excreted virulence factor EspC, type VII ESX diderm [Saccharopolyspora flava]